MLGPILAALQVSERDVGTFKQGAARALQEALRHYVEGHASSPDDSQDEEEEVEVLSPVDVSQESLFDALSRGYALGGEGEADEPSISI